MDMRYGNPKLKYFTLRMMYDYFVFFILNSLLYHYMLIKIINDCILPWYMRNYFFTGKKTKIMGYIRLIAMRGRR